MTRCTVKRALACLDGRQAPCCIQSITILYCAFFTHMYPDSSVAHAYKNGRKRRRISSSSQRAPGSFRNTGNYSTDERAYTAIGYSTRTDAGT